MAFGEKIRGLEIGCQSYPIALDVDRLSCRIVKLHPRIGKVVLHHQQVDVRLHDLVDDEVSRFIRTENVSRGSRWQHTKRKACRQERKTFQHIIVRFSNAKIGGFVRFSNICSAIAPDF